jgi:uncharacterized protein (TIGR03083 family)
MPKDPWPLIHAERRALLDDVKPLSEEQWATASLCDGWSVRDVFGHITATAKQTPPRFFAGLIGTGFKFNALMDKLVARETAVPASAQIAEFESRITATNSPPGPGDTWLGEIIVHAEDLRRPLGITRQYPPEAVTRVIDSYKGSNLLIGGKRRVAGLGLRATDADWSTGVGPEVTGSALSLLLATAGRESALEELAGPGLAELRTRFQPTR